jgi:hypothetical protein
VTKIKIGIHILAGSNNNIGMAMYEARTLLVFMRQDVPKGRRKFNIEELHYFRSSDTHRVIKLRISEMGETWKR